MFMFMFMFHCGVVCVLPNLANRALLTYLSHLPHTNLPTHLSFQTSYFFHELAIQVPNNDKPRSTTTPNNPPLGPRNPPRKHPSSQRTRHHKSHPRHNNHYPQRSATNRLLPRSNRAELNCPSNQCHCQSQHGDR